MEKWMHRFLIGVKIVVSVVALGLVAGLFLPVVAKFWAGVWSWVSQPSELGRFGWELLTGPPAAGALAVLAACIAYRGLDKTVKRQDTANEMTRSDNIETIRKNSEDQWWATLKWAYGEAKEFKKNDQKPEVAAVAAVLEALSKQRALSPVQASTVASVSKLFEDNPDHEIRESAVRSQEAARAFDYLNAVESMLQNLPLEGVTVSEAVGSPDAGFDLVLSTPKAQIGIVVKAGSSPARAGAANDLLSAVRAPSSNKKINAGLLITESGFERMVYGMLQSSMTKASVVKWNPGESTEKVEKVVTELFGTSKA